MRLALAPKAVEVEEEVVGGDSSKGHLGGNEAIAKLSSPAR